MPSLVWKLVQLVLVTFICINFVNGQSNRFERLKELQKKSRVIEFTDDTIQTYLTQQTNFSVVLLIATINSQIPGAEEAKQATQEFATVAEAYYSSLGSGGYNSQTFLQQPIFFARCELEKCKNTFREGGTKAGWRAIPKLVLIRPREEKGSVDVNGWVDMNADAVTARGPEMASWIRGITKYPISVEISFIERYGNNIVTLILGGAIIYSIFPRLREWVTKRIFWFVVSLATYAFSMAGMVFNSIHLPPWYYIHPQSHQTMYIYPSPRQQFIAEGLIIAAISVGIGLACIGFGYWVPIYAKDNAQKRLGFVVLAFIFITLYTQLMGIFRVKYGWYPF